MTRRSPASSFGALNGVLMVFCLIGFPVIASFSHITGVPSTPLSIGARTLLAAIASIIVLKSFAERKRRATLPLLTVLVLAFWFLYFLRLSSDTLIEFKDWSRPNWHYWAWAFGACFLPFLALSLRMDQVNYDRILKAIYALAIVVLTIALLEGSTLAGDDFNTYDSGRLKLESLNPISLGNVSGLVVVLTAWILLGAVHYRLKLHVILVLILSGLMATYIMLSTGSRGPLLSTAVALLVLLMTSRPSRVLSAIAIAFLIAVLALPFIPLIDLDLSAKALERIGSLGSGGDITFISRLDSLGEAMDLFQSSPLTGSAIELKGIVAYPHNFIAESLMATGIMGGVLSLGLLSVGAFSAYRVLLRRAPYSWIGLLFFQFAVQAQFSGAMYSLVELWGLLGMLSALVALQLKSRSVLKPNWSDARVASGSSNHAR